MTVQTHGLGWAREVKTGQIRPSTAADYEDHFRRYVFPYLGNVRMVDFSANTINGTRRVLFGMCKRAVRTNVIPFNPVSATDPVKRPGNEARQVKHPWSKEEIIEVLERVEGMSSWTVF